MLGLGSAIYMSKLPGLKLLGTYTSDFSSNTDGWSALSVEGDLELTANATVAGSDGWLKGEFDENQTDSLSGIEKNSPLGATSMIGDYWSISYKIYLSSSNWTHESGETDDVNHIFKYVHVGSSDYTTDFFGANNAAAKGQAVSYDFNVATAQTSTTPLDLLQFYFTNTTTKDDVPQAGAIFYLKDIVLKAYRS